MLVDSYLWLIASVFIAGLLTDGESLASDDWTGADTVGGFIALGVFAALAAHNGRSLGKLVFGGRIVTTDDRPRTFGLVITRMLLAAALSVFFITHLAALGNPERQTLHDRITRTRVVRTR
jgi:uncharacterized RDD family membrane protein YckC